MYMCNQFNVRSTMEIRRAHLCDFFLVLLFYDIFMYKIMSESLYLERRHIAALTWDSMFRSRRAAILAGGGVI